MKKWCDIKGWFPTIECVMLQKLAVGKSCIEIGSYKGRSTLCLAEVATHVYSIDIEEHPGFKDNIIGYPITIFTMSSVDGSKHFEQDSVDLIFIDGSHLYPDVKLDILNWWDKLRSNGVMCFHDYEAPGHDGVAKAVNEFFELTILKRFNFLAWVIKNDESSEHINKELKGLT